MELIEPLLKPLLIDPSTLNLLPKAGISEIHFFYGLIMGSYSIAMFFGVPILGDLSDRLGRKPILIMCLIGTFLGQILAIFSILWKSIEALILCRIISGFTAGSLAVAQAAVIDVSTDQNRTIHIGYLLLALSLGVIIGPLLAGFLSDSKLVVWFNVSTPFYFAALFSFINIPILYFTFKENFAPIRSQKIRLMSVLSVIFFAFKTKTLRKLSFGFLLMQLSVATFIQFIVLFLSEKYSFTTSEISIYLSCIGLGYTIALFYILKRTTQYLSLPMIISLFTIAGSLCLLLALLVNSIVIWLISIPLAICIAISYSGFISLFSKLVNENKQGKIMGSTAAISAFSFGFTGFFAGVLANFGISFPLWFSFICLFFSGIYCYFFITNNINKENLNLKC